MKMHPFQVIDIFVAWKEACVQRAGEHSSDRLTNARHESFVVGAWQQIWILRRTVDNAFHWHHVPWIVVAFEFLTKQ